jgi:hypothetical protein
MDGDQVANLLDQLSAFTLGVLILHQQGEIDAPLLNVEIYGDYVVLEAHVLALEGHKLLVDVLGVLLQHFHSPAVVPLPDALLQH